MFATLYKSQADYELIPTWIGRFFIDYGTDSRGIMHYPDPARNVWLQIDSVVHQSGFDLDNSWVKMKLIMDYFEAGDTTSAFRLANSLKIKTLELSIGDQTNFYKNMIILVAEEFVKRGKKQEANRLIMNFSNRKNRIKVYINMAYSCQLNNLSDDSKQYYDSVITEMSRLKDFKISAVDFRVALVGLLTLQNTKESENKTLQYIGFMSGYDRANGILQICFNYSRLGNYYKAKRMMSGYASSVDKVAVYPWVLFFENMKKGNSKEWDPYLNAKLRSRQFHTTQNDLLPD